VIDKAIALPRQVSIEEGDAKAREFSVMFIETSAKAGFNIKVCCLLTRNTSANHDDCRQYLMGCYCNFMNVWALSVHKTDEADRSRTIALQYCHVASVTATCCVRSQALFRKIAAALPGMESLSTQKQEDLVDVNLTSNSAQNKGAGQTGAVSGCQCWRVVPGA